MFITNTHDSFHLWWKENLGRHQKVSKYYDQDCRLISDVENLFMIWEVLLKYQKNIKFLLDIDLVLIA